MLRQLSLIVLIIFYGDETPIHGQFKKLSSQIKVAFSRNLNFSRNDDANYYSAFGEFRFPYFAITLQIKIMHLMCERNSGIS